MEFKAVYCKCLFLLSVWTFNEAAPSSCERTSTKGRMDCGYRCSSQLNGWDFMELANTMPKCPSFFFYLSSGKYHSFPANFFTSVRKVEHFFFEMIRVDFDYFPSSKSTISPFKNVTFDVSAYVHLVNVTSNHQWNWELFSELKSAKGGTGTFDCLWCNIRHLDKSFSNMLNGSVTAVRFIEGNMRSLDEGVFPFPSLKFLRLHDNEIEVMKRNYFRIPAPVLEMIDIGNNKIQYLPLNMFVAMPSLQYVVLESNMLTTLSETVLRPIVNVALLNLSCLPLHCNCSLRWMKFAMMNNPTLIEDEPPVCHSPPKYVNISFADISLQELEC